MQLVDKHDTQGPSSENWRTKVSPIPSFLQDADKDDLFPANEKDEGSPIMKGILYTILTATIGVLVGYLVSYLMRSPQASTIQALEELANSVKTQSNTILVAGKDADKKGDSKPTAPANNKAAPASSPPAAAMLTAAPAAATPPPVAPTPPGVSAAPTAPAPSTPPAAAPAASEKPKDAAPAPAAAAAAPAPVPPPAEKPAAAKKPTPQGPVFLKGTNPYGPPPLVEQDIFDASSTLRVEYDPSTPQPTGYTAETVDAPTFQQLLQDPATPAPQASFHVQLGAFSSRIHATQFANRLQEKGYEVNIYEGRAKNHGTWYLVRLDKDFDHVTALETAKNIYATEKFLPMVVQPTDTEKKLR